MPATANRGDPLSIDSLLGGPDVVSHFRPDGKPDFTKRWTKYPPPPPPPTDEQFWLVPGQKPQAAFLRKHFFYEGKLLEHQALWIIREATRILRMEPNVLSVTSPVTICGDIHGQYFDLMRLMEPAIGGSPSKTRYLFLGDYVDRGVFGIECLLMLYSLKINFPNNFLLLRGNHECRRLTDYFTFRLECRRKYSDMLYEAALESFNALPLAAVVDNTLFCVHGGISPSMETVSDILKIDRFQEPPTKGLMCDLLWSDPARDHSHDEITFVENSQRGCSFQYGYKAIRKFLDDNKFRLVIRAHEVEEKGFRRFTTDGQRAHLMTLFSAPNYLDFYGNMGAVMVYEGGKMSVRQFTHAQHPYQLPNFADVFTWSLPFVALKATEMLHALLSVFPEEEYTDSEEDSDMEIDSPDLYAQVAGEPRHIRFKNRASGNSGEDRVPNIKRRESKRFTKFYRILREETEGASELGRKARHPGYANELGQGGPDIRPGTPFKEVRELDMVNERLPEQFIEYQEVANRRSAQNTPNHRPNQVVSEPEAYEEDAIIPRLPSNSGYNPRTRGPQGPGARMYNEYVGNRDGPERRDSVGTTYTSAPSTRRTTWEDKDEIVRGFASMSIRPQQ
ncbi:related to phosphoprotein phosphatase 3-alpha catalytic chain [Serendipita indica DSM 11827]|uniref:Serine/threonine-protein phosphatase n=1 Tax=Serendipita indica (strain DSM 11827) TaxID=1109443 RepID=G4TBQ3_SERID|nr:related to phosphoprotein phosphatase 3-alpha catalytic chain [Serendipita indica DSM 11827]